MIKAKFFNQSDLLTGFEISGHSGSAERGEDIICSAVSSAAYMAANTVTEILSVEADIKVDDGYLYFKVAPLSETQAILKGLRLHLISLSQDYPKNIKVTNI
ncbi:MAG: ribosomal-processing cysteine protease Prp [Clostridia bacterium]|nr:ribosomal-processing cysteine protease Prp [Clostridia bacterium]